MKSVQVKNVPEDVHAELRKRAALAGQSLQEYLLALLVEEARCPSAEEIFGRVNRRGGWNLSLARAAELVRADRESH